MTTVVNHHMAGENSLTDKYYNHSMIITRSKHSVIWKKKKKQAVIPSMLFLLRRFWETGPSVPPRLIDRWRRRAHELCVCLAHQHSTGRVNLASSQSALNLSFTV